MDANLLWKRAGIVMPAFWFHLPSEIKEIGIP